MIGGAGRDLIFGGAGRDLLTTNSFSQGPDDGGDELFGGTGDDTFVFVRADHSPLGDADKIGDFQQGSDRLDFSFFQHGTGQGTEFVIFRFIGNAAFSGAQELRFQNGVLRGDADADGQADLVLQLPGITTMTEADFILLF